MTTQCCIAGGGPAGLMLGYLLARAGIDVVVVEKHSNFLSDFRGNTIHPSTMQIMHELGILEEFLAIPHREIKKLEAVFNGRRIRIADFTRLPAVKPVLGYMPQDAFLGFIAEKASRYPTFHLLKEATVTGFLYDKGEVAGLSVTTKTGVLEISGQLVVGADGRHSAVRNLAGLDPVRKESFIDIVWFRLSKVDTDPLQSWIYADGRTLVTIDWGQYWQCGIVIKKGKFNEFTSGSIEAFREGLLKIAPFFNGRVNEIKGWDDVKLLDIQMDHLEKWYTPGVLCIGDAAHAMSPVSGVGINIAIQDAIATANLLYPHFRKPGRITPEVLRRVQKRRLWPVKGTQFVQSGIQKGLANRHPESKLPAFLQVQQALPFLTIIPAWIFGLGLRQERLRTPELLPENV